MNLLRGRGPSPALLVALLALLVATSGTAYAALAKNSVGSSQVKNNSLKGKDIRDGKLTGTDVADNSLKGADIDEASLAAVPNAMALNGQAASSYALSAQPGFTEATLSGGFSNVGSGYTTAGYMKDSLGFVHLKGFMSCPDSENTAFTLPPGFRPSATVFMPMGVNSGRPGNLQVTAAGLVRPFLDIGPDLCSLDGAVFKAADVARPVASARPGPSVND